ncbi:MAG: hypothetical protein HXY45_02355 [Syntrophaceae bacterium]|nr:hypothetical protein [Syntrophaceae bacterium]
MNAAKNSFLAPLPVTPAGGDEDLRFVPRKNQLERILRKRGKARLDAILLAEKPEELARTLPEWEIFMTVQEVGKRDCLELLNLVTPQQFQYLVDLDAWRKDRLIPEKILEWMEIMTECGDEKFEQFVRTADLEVIIFVLKKFIQVTKQGKDPLRMEEEPPAVSLESLYSVSFKDERSRDILQAFLKKFLHLDSDLYRRVMEGIIWELESDLEEAAYRWRNARLADLGFPDFQEALEIYRFVNPRTASLEGKPFIPREPGENGLASAFPLILQGVSPVFSSALRRLDHPSERHAVRAELVSLFNKAIIAESLADFSREEMERVGRKVFHYLNLGLQTLCREKAAPPENILRSVSPQKIFQCGFGSTLLLKKRAEAIFKGPWLEGNRHHLAFLDSPHGEMMKGLLRKRPALYRNGLYMDFETLEDLQEMGLFLEMIDAATQFLVDHLGLSPRKLKETDWRGYYPSRWEDMTLATILLTSWGNRILKNVFSFMPIEKGQLPILLRLFFEPKEAGLRVLRRELRKEIYDWMKSVAKEEGRRISLQRFWDYCFHLLEEQYARISPADRIDPRFTRGLLIR